ncbi:hypothetical protein [Polaromonas sp. A23]|uniref:hypothetical protein n=1 Tax=Polaromonas sp. A23 TaxID=1944133 RepID=UPI0009847A8F|nr:hypothetical protein [Polaromonas sp. A23]OOG41030.1 hypothetical protein B0B52_11815 [Polaromonas sp. A23]
MGLPVMLDPVLSARLREALCTVAPGDGAGAGMLRAALDDPAVCTVVVAVKLGSAPGASLVQIIRSSDPIAQWMDLACI